MKREEVIMGMTIRVEIVDPQVSEGIFTEIFDFFKNIDRRFSTFKKDSEISQLNSGILKEENLSNEMKEIFSLARKTYKDTLGYFDIKKIDGILDPSGIVKGWAIKRAAEILEYKGYKNFYIDCGGDIEVRGTKNGSAWTIGIRHPFEISKFAKVLNIKNAGVATSGNYVHKTHIYNPKNGKPVEEIVSLTVIASNIYEADRYATGAFAMGRNGINFLETVPGVEAYVIDRFGMATYTSGFNQFTINSNA